jgi:hypothetical protein
MHSEMTSTGLKASGRPRARDLPALDVFNSRGGGG